WAAVATAGRRSNAETTTAGTAAQPQCRQSRRGTAGQGLFVPTAQHDLSGSSGTLRASHIAENVAGLRLVANTAKVLLPTAPTGTAPWRKSLSGHSMTTSCNLRAPGMRTLMGRAMPLDPHCRGQRSDPLVLLVPHRDDDNAEIALRQPAGSDLSRRAGCRLHGVLQAVEFGALVIAHGRLYILDIEIVT